MHFSIIKIFVFIFRFFLISILEHVNLVYNYIKSSHFVAILNNLLYINTINSWVWSTVTIDK